MFFNKIKQTISVLRTRPPKRTIQDVIDAHGIVLHESISGHTPAKIVRIGVYLAVALPSSILISEILYHLTNLSAKETGALGVLTGILMGFSIRWIHDQILDRVPFHKLNPYFGSKIEETISALKKSS
jgi:hypothetical protein